MDLEPRTLEVPLHPRQWFWLRAIAVVGLVATALLFFLPGFGIPFAASALVGAPVLLPYVLSLRVQRAIRAGGLAVRGAVFIAVMLYLFFAKRVLTPWLTSWLQSVAG